MARSDGNGTRHDGSAGRRNVIFVDDDDDPSLLDDYDPSCGDEADEENSKAIGELLDVIARVARGEGAQLVALLADRPVLQGDARGVETSSRGTRSRSFSGSRASSSGWSPRSRGSDICSNSSTSLSTYRRARRRASTSGQGGGDDDDATLVDQVVVRRRVPRGVDGV